MRFSCAALFSSPPPFRRSLHSLSSLSDLLAVSKKKESFSKKKKKLTGQHEAGVDQAVEHLCRALDELVLLLGQPVRPGGVGVEDQVEGVVVVGDLGAEAGEVEVVLDVVLVDLFWVSGGGKLKIFFERVFFFLSGNFRGFFLFSFLSRAHSSFFSLQPFFSPIINISPRRKTRFPLMSRTR